MAKKVSGNKECDTWWLGWLPRSATGTTGPQYHGTWSHYTQRGWRNCFLCNEHKWGVALGKNSNSEQKINVYEQTWVLATTYLIRPVNWSTFTARQYRLPISCRITFFYLSSWLRVNLLVKTITEGNPIM